MEINGVKLRVHESARCSTCNKSPLEYSVQICLDCTDKKLITQCANPWTHQGEQPAPRLFLTCDRTQRFCSEACFLPADGVLSVQVSCMGQVFEQPVKYATATAAGLIRSVIGRMTDPYPRPHEFVRKESFVLKTSFDEGATYLDVISGCATQFSGAWLKDFFKGACSNMTIGEYLMCTKGRDSADWQVTTSDGRVLEPNQLLFEFQKEESFTVSPVCRSTKRKRAKPFSFEGMPPESDYPDLLLLNELKNAKLY